MVNFTVLRNVVLTSSKIIRHFENSQLIFTWHKMVSMCAKFHCHTISSLENARVGHFCPLPPPFPQIKYAIPDIPNKIGLIALKNVLLQQSAYHLKETTTPRQANFNRLLILSDFDRLFTYMYL